MGPSTKMGEAECLFCCTPLEEGDIINGLCEVETCRPHAFCRACVQRYFTDQITSSYYGSCKKMKCPTCIRVIPYQIWKPLVEEETRDTFVTRASQLLSLQCGGCHERKSLQLQPSASESDKAYETIDAALGGDNQRDAFNTTIKQFLRGEMTAQSALTELADLLPTLMNDADQGTILADTLMGSILTYIQDPERRAVLHLRFLHLKPSVFTPCCRHQHCFRCKTKQYHDGVTCEQFMETQEVLDDVLPCPSCGLQLVKGDGCSTVTCLCGETFNWRRVVIRETRIRAFLASHPEDAPMAAASIMRNPDLHGSEEVEQARAWGMANQESLRAARVKLFKRDNPLFTAKHAILIIDKNSTQCPERTVAQAWARANQEEVDQIREENSRLRALTWEVLHGPNVHPITFHASHHPRFYDMAALDKVTQSDLCFRAYCERKAEEVKAAAARYEDNVVQAMEAMFGKDRAMSMAVHLRLGRSAGLEHLSEIQEEFLETYARLKSSEVEAVIVSQERERMVKKEQEFVKNRTRMDAALSDFYTKKYRGQGLQIFP